MSIVDDWDARYISIGGFFGQYSPHLFAAAPELCAALEAVLDGTAWAHIDADALRDARAALELAKGSQ